MTRAPVRETIQTRYGHLTDPLARLTAAAEENVLFALENLRAYPSVQRGLADGSVRLHAWFFKISTAELFAYDPQSHQFAPLVSRGVAIRRPTTSQRSTTARLCSFEFR